MKSWNQGFSPFHRKFLRPVGPGTSTKRRPEIILFPFCESKRIERIRHVQPRKSLLIHISILIMAWFDHGTFLSLFLAAFALLCTWTRVGGRQFEICEKEVQVIHQLWAILRSTALRGLSRSGSATLVGSQRRDSFMRVDVDGKRPGTSSEKSPLRTASAAIS